MPFYSARNLCPNCAKPISREATTCEACGCELEPRNPGGGPPLPDGVARHRGGRIVVLAVVSLLALPIANCALSLSGYLLRIGFQEALPYLGLSLVSLAVGHSFAGVGVYFAFRDWVGMRVGRVDDTGRTRTLVGGSLAAVSLLLYWWMTIAIVASWL